MDWEKIQPKLLALVEANRLSELRGALMMLSEVDIAEFLNTLDREKMVMVFRILPKDMSADVFSYMDSDERQSLLESIGDGEITKLLDNMFLDDAVDFLEELPASVVKRVMQNADPHTRDLINQFLRYPENSAGSIMTIEFCEFHAGITVKRAMEEIKKTGIDKETIYTLYVIDAARKLMGTVALRKLILAPDDAMIEDILAPNPVCVRTLDDQETVADTVRKYDLMSIPVVDNEDRLVGIITADDVMDVIEEENTEDFEKMAALTPSEDEYLKTTPFQMFLNRIPWLIILMVSATFSGMIINHYEGLLAGVAGLTAFIPMLMDTGGNCGSQASTLVIRGLALGEVQFRDLFKVLWREVRVSFLVAVVLGLVAFLRAMFFDRVGMTASLVVSGSLCLTVVLAKAIGCTLPMLAKKLKLDPALMASPLITTLVDACSLLIYFSIATKVIV